MINTLSKTLGKRGQKYVNDLLNDNVTITEKIDTLRILFERKKDKFLFYKKDNSPITIVERTLSDIYENAIAEIPLITKDAEIPEGYVFGVYYTPVERPLRIPYSKLPRYILTDVTKRDENDKIIESCDYKQVKEWASILCMGRPPILFEGKLNEEQKKLLIAYDTKQYNGEVMTFSKMIEKAFNASYSKEDIIEGIIVKSGEKITQIISYEFELLNEAYEKENTSRDFYDIIISDLNEFLDSYSLPILETENKNQLYINIICDIFNKYCEYGRVNENIEAKYLTPPQFGYNGKLNKRFISNKDTLTWVSKAPIYEALFKVFLSSFRKYKKPYGLLTESIIEKFNSYVYLINNCIIGKEKEGSEENVNNLHNFINEHFINEARSENIVIDAVKKRNITDIDNMRVIASIQKAFEPKINDVVRGKTPCIVYITTFEPFTTSQMNNVVRMSKMWNYPVIVFAVSNKYKTEGKDFHASDELVRAQMQALMNDNTKLVPGFGLLVSWSLVEIFQYCRPDFEPMVVITDTGKKSEMVLQLYLEEEIMGGRINVEKDFNIGELENEDKLQAFRAIEDNNYTLLKELTPHAVHGTLDMIISEYRLWSGQVLKPIND